MAPCLTVTIGFYRSQTQPAGNPIAVVFTITNRDDLDAIAAIQKIHEAPLTIVIRRIRDEGVTALAFSQKGQEEICRISLTRDQACSMDSWSQNCSVDLVSLDQFTSFAIVIPAYNDEFQALVAKRVLPSSA